MSPQVGVYGKVEVDAIIATHNKLVTSHDDELLPDLLKRAALLVVDTDYGWTGYDVGSGSGIMAPTYLQASTGATPNSSQRYRLLLRWQSPGASGWNKHNWDKKLYIVFNYTRMVSDSEVVARFQLKMTSAEGALAAHGLGIRLDNFDLVGESYGSELGEVDLGTSLTNDVPVRIGIVLYPGVSVKWYVNNVEVGTQSTAAKIPSGDDVTYVVLSIINGVTGGFNCYSYISAIELWQEV